MRALRTFSRFTLRYIYFVRFSRDCGAFIGTLYSGLRMVYIIYILRLFRLYMYNVLLKRSMLKDANILLVFFFSFDLNLCICIAAILRQAGVHTRTSQTCCSPLAAPHCSEEAQWGRWYGKDCKASIYLQTKNRTVVVQRHLLCGGSRTLSTVSFWRKLSKCKKETVANFIFVWTVAEMKYLNFEDAKQFMKRYNFIILNRYVKKYKWAKTLADCSIQF